MPAGGGDDCGDDGGEDGSDGGGDHKGRGGIDIYEDDMCNKGGGGMKTHYIHTYIHKYIHT